jgi:transcriptional regulator with XRE-family HTH domain
MDAEELRALRKELGVTARDLAAAIGVEQEVVLAWERGELFATKQHVTELMKLRARGAGAVPRAARKGATTMQVLADPALWQLFRKLIAHDALRKEVLRIAERYDDPTDL